MRDRLPVVPYPVLPLPRKSSAAVLSGAFWCALAATLHVLVYAAARFASAPSVVDAEPMKTPAKNHVVVVQDLLTDAPLPQVSTPAAAVSPPTKTDTGTERKKRRSPKQQRRAIPAQTADASPQPEKRKIAFRDIGMMGSLDVRATGPGGSFSVAVGNSGVGGPIGRHGGIEGVVSPHATKNAAPPLIAALPKQPPPVSARDLSRKAVPKTRYNLRLKAAYPKHLRKKAIAGEVLAALLVLADGTVGHVEILRSADEAFTESAIRVIKQFLFEPALDKDGKAVTSRVRLTYRFLLE